MAEYFVGLGYRVKASTKSIGRLQELAAKGTEPFIVDIESLDNDIATFLQADILIINITSKKLDSFARLITKIEESGIEKVLFVSSTSVYANLNKVLCENDGAELSVSPLYRIEQLFRYNVHFLTTVVRFSGLIAYSRHPGRFFRQGKVVTQADAPVNLIHRDDCIAIISEIIRQDAWGEVFNGCADTHPDKREFYSHARKLLKLPAPEFSTETKKAFKIISNAKVKQVLNYQFLYPDVMDIHYD